MLFAHPVDDILSVELLNTSGQVAMAIDKSQIMSRSETFDFDVSSLERGVYFVKISTVTTTHVETLIVQ